MTAKYVHTEHVHPYPWETVAQAVFQRYPNPFATHVLSDDTLHREVRGHTLYSRRFITKTNKLPKWGEKFFMGLKRYVPLVEESTVDTENRVLTTYTRNVGLGMFMMAVERVRYTVDPANPGNTIAVKEAWIESSLYGLRSAVKNFGVERFRQNCHKASDGLNFVLQQLVQNTGPRMVFINEMGAKKWADLKHKGEVMKHNAREKALHAAEVAKSHATLHAAAEVKEDEAQGRN